ncbi:MAG TPA: hypothetical protein DET40_20165 [Lentisphaeria bacterium]|nr:MAG: hypothetical protein A2X45_16595 [Lentisphaerae bacterium GWF2_50_93]HCE45867.1 hypothetical protein [Lentisphaeria bacterium]
MKRKSSVFKKCSGCGASWLDRSLFLSDPNVKLVGYQVHFKDLELGLFLFNHSCGSTVSLEARNFTDLYKGPVFKDNKKNTCECGGLCLHSEELSPCPVKCECAYVREVLLLINNVIKK